MRRILMAVIICLFASGFAFAAEKGTAKEAQSMVEKAIAYYKANGKDKAFAAINDPKGPFTKKDLYVSVTDVNGINVAHGANKAMVGKNFYELKDSSGKQFIKEIIDGANSKGSGWCDYNWTNPTTKKIEAKSSYYQKEGTYIFMCGIYK